MTLTEEQLEFEFGALSEGISVAKATLIEATNQAGGGFVTLDGVLLTLDVEEDISVHSGMLYMNSHNIKVEFVKSDFEDISDGTLENIALKLEVESSGSISKSGNSVNGLVNIKSPQFEWYSLP